MDKGIALVPASKMAGVSYRAVHRYLLEPDNQELRNYFFQKKSHVLWLSNNVLNEVVGERTKPQEGEEIYDSDGNLKQTIPTQRAVTTAKFNKVHVDPDYVKKPDHLIVPIGQVNLAPERKQEIDGLLDNWDSPDPEPYDVNS